MASQRFVLRSNLVDGLDSLAARGVPGGGQRAENLNGSRWIPLARSSPGLPFRPAILLLFSFPLSRVLFYHPPIIILSEREATPLSLRRGSTRPLARPMEFQASPLPFLPNHHPAPALSNIPTRTDIPQLRRSPPLHPPLQHSRPLCTLACRR